MPARFVPFLLAALLVARVAAQPSWAQEARIAQSIRSLHQHPWPGARYLANPTTWDFHFTQPMRELLTMGSVVQEPLLAKLSDPEIADQIIILLGGVGDERSVEPIIDAMRQARWEPQEERRRRILLAGNLALTNITVADVIWHHGGGILVTACPEDPAACWSAWWHKNKATFQVKDITQSRRYSNYPNYGIYGNLP